MILFLKYVFEIRIRLFKLDHGHKLVRVFCPEFIIYIGFNITIKFQRILRSPLIHFLLIIYHKFSNILLPFALLPPTKIFLSTLKSIKRSHPWWCFWTGGEYIEGNNKWTTWWSCCCLGGLIPRKISLRKTIKISTLPPNFTISGYWFTLTSIPINPTTMNLAHIYLPDSYTTILTPA